MTSAADLLDDDLEVTGRVMPASNATFVGRVGDLEVVYKPVSGERPLWDFPDGVLAEREVAAWHVSEAFGWDVVPRTWLRDGPYGPGMVQLWRHSDPDQEAVTLVPSDEVPTTGWRHAFDGYDAQDRAVSLVHEDTAALRRVAVFDVVTNNADRKGGHVLEMADGHRHGIDHGLTFHAEHKLRTVLWGWAGEPLSDEELAGVQRVRAALEGELLDVLEGLLTVREVEAFATRCDRLLRAGCLPEPRGGMPSIPWPPF